LANIENFKSAVEASKVTDKSSGSPSSPPQSPTVAGIGPSQGKGQVGGQSV
jgi:hypothetical protein